MIGVRCASLRESGKIPVLRDRLMIDVRTGMIDGRQVLRRSAGMGSRGLDSIGEFFTSSNTYLFVRRVNWVKPDDEVGSGNSSKVTMGSRIAGIES